MGDLSHIAENLRGLATPVAELHADPANARTGHDVRRIAESLRAYGQRKPLVANRAQGGKVEAGNGTLAAALSLGWTHVAVVWVDDDPATAAAFGIADNRTGELSRWDAEALGALADVTQGLFTAFTGDELAEVLGVKPAGTADAEPQVDRAEELRVKWQVEPGDLWRIGEHRLICGDCTDASVVARVMGGEKANLIFTSPPYAMQREKMYGGIPANQYVDWWDGVQSIARAVLSDDGSFFVNIKPNAAELDRELYVFDLVLAMVRRWEWHFAEEFCWERAGLPQQVVRRFKNQFEPIYHFVKSEWKFRPDAVRFESDRVPKAQGPGAGDTNAAKRQGKISAVHGNTIEAGLAYPGNRLPTFQDVTQVFGHPAIFPTGLVSFFVKAYTDIADLVYEPFSGSGTTMVACENLGRRCRAVEIAPGYVAVALERMATAFPGIVIERVG